MVDEEKKVQSAAQEPKVKKARIRSPNYPAISLVRAVQRAKELYDQFRHSPIPIGIAHSKWGYKPLGNDGYRIMSALKAYGLVDYEGDGEKRLVKLSDRARKIVGGHLDKDSLVRDAALNPPIYAEIWGKYKADGLPPDETLHHYLQWEKSFNPDSIKNFIVDLRDTFSYAKLASTGIEEGGNGEGGENGDAPGAAGGDPQEKSASETPPLRRAELPRGEPGMRTDTWILQEGPAVALQYPAAWTQSSYEEFKDWIELELRRIKRLIKAEDKPENEAQEPQPRGLPPAA